MSYATDFYEGYIKPFNITEFTHRDILIHTTTNCSYTVLQDLKDILFKENKTLTESERCVNKKRFKVYKIEDKECRGGLSYTDNYQRIQFG